jgi:UDP-2,3-diacylglucosamine pyrophosphatase LpxH
MVKKLIIVSDLHLGYEHSDKKSFNSFLDSLSQDFKPTHFVLLGDIVDMWRRDASGVFLENRDTIEKILNLSEQNIEVHYVAGNHDFHVLKLKDHSYPFNFEPNYSLTDGDYTYTFKHGYEFDPAQKPPLMEALCHVMSDKWGSYESKLWEKLTAGWTDSQRRDAEDIQAIPEKRLKERKMKETILDEKRQEYSKLKPKEILIYGHTHQPYINESENMVNTGSWVTDASVHNTFVELSNGKPKLYTFKGKEITERTTLF